MNQAQKDKAWRVFEIAFATSLGLFVLIRWKPFLDWFIRYVAELVKAVVLLFLLAGALLLIRKMFPDDD
jgi:hypothetical protein